MSERAARAAAAVAGVGLLVAVAGMFLPWLRSGAVLRDSFQLVGLIRTLGFLRGDVLDLLLRAWFAAIPAITLGVVAYALGARRAGATICLVATIFIGTIAGGATVESDGGDSSLGIAGTGPAVTLIGSALAVLGAVGVLMGRRRSAGETAGGEL